MVVNREEFAERLNSSKRKARVIHVSGVAIGAAIFIMLLTEKPRAFLLEVDGLGEWASMLYLALIFALFLAGISLVEKIEAKFLLKRGVSCPLCMKSIPVHLGKAVIVNGYCPNCGKSLFVTTPNKPVHPSADAPDD
jgi:hypothetical protein